MTARKISLFAAIFSLLATVPDMAFAGDSIRCGRHIVSAGQRHGPFQYEILKKCGEPTTRSGLNWVYEKSGAATRILVFDFSGRLMRIERLSRTG